MNEGTRARGNDRSQDEDSLMAKIKRAKRVFKTLIISFVCSDAGFDQYGEEKCRSWFSGLNFELANFEVLFIHLFYQVETKGFEFSSNVLLGSLTTHSRLR